MQQVASISLFTLHVYIWPSNLLFFEYEWEKSWNLENVANEKQWNMIHSLIHIDSCFTEKFWQCDSSFYQYMLATDKTVM